MTDSFRQDISEMGSEARTAVAEGAEKVKEKGSELGRKAAASIDAKRDKVASGMESVAHGLHGRVDSMAETGAKVSQAAHGAADSLESAAQYVRDHDTKEMLSDLEAVIRKHPGKSLLAVLAVGYLAGRALQRD